MSRKKSGPTFSNFTLCDRVMKTMDISYGNISQMEK
jgi:hypothetical protein